MANTDTSLAKFLNDMECASSIYAFEIVDEEQKELKMLIATGETTPYAGAMYEVVFRFPESYPFGVPHATFGSPIWNTWVHPVNKHVHFDDSHTWNVIDSLGYVEGLIQKPDMDEFSTFFRVARFWAAEYGGAPKSPEDDHLRSAITQLVAMGFAEPAVIMALSHSGWDTEAALEELIKEAEDNDW